MFARSRILSHAGRTFHRIRANANRPLRFIPRICYGNSRASRVSLLTLPMTALVPSTEEETFEMGLYVSSLKELEQAEKDLSQTRRALRAVFSFLEPIRILLRALELLVIFIPVGLAYPISWIGPWDPHKSTKLGHIFWCRLVRYLLEFAGPTFIKMGQWAGSRTDLFSPALCHELSYLHTNVKAHSWSYTKTCLLNALGVRDLSQAFETFNDTPVGVGSIAQVYNGTLSKEFAEKNEIPSHERECAIKILHPKVRDKIQRDIRIMEVFAKWINIIPNMEWLSLPDEVEQFSILMNLQLDLRIEGWNLQRFNENFKNTVLVKFPKPWMHLTSREILFEEYIDGIPMGHFLAAKPHIKDQNLCKRISSPFVDAFLKMLILDDFVHADLHPGNVMVRFVKTNSYGVTSTVQWSKEVSDYLNEAFDNVGDGPVFAEILAKVLRDYSAQVCFIDTGLVTELNERNRINFLALFNALATFNGRKAGELMIERSRTPETAIDADRFADQVSLIVKRIERKTFTLGTISIGELLEKIMTMVRAHHVRMEGDFISVVVAIFLLEGIGRQLDPDLDLFASSLPILHEFSTTTSAMALIRDAGIWSTIKTMISLEFRSLISTSAREMYNFVMSDQLSPNY